MRASVCMRVCVMLRNIEKWNDKYGRKRTNRENEEQLENGFKSFITQFHSHVVVSNLPRKNSTWGNIGRRRKKRKFFRFQFRSSGQIKFYLFTKWNREKIAWKITQFELTHLLARSLTPFDTYSCMVLKCLASIFA